MCLLLIQNSDYSYQNYLDIIEYSPEIMCFLLIQTLFY